MCVCCVLERTLAHRGEERMRESFLWFVLTVAHFLPSFFSSSSSFSPFNLFFCLHPILNWPRQIGIHPLPSPFLPSSHQSVSQSLPHSIAHSITRSISHSITHSSYLPIPASLLHHAPPRHSFLFLLPRHHSITPQLCIFASSSPKHKSQSANSDSSLSFITVLSNSLIPYSQHTTHNPQQA